MLGATQVVPGDNESCCRGQNIPRRRQLEDCASNIRKLKSTPRKCPSVIQQASWVTQVYYVIYNPLPEESRRLFVSCVRHRKASSDGTFHRYLPTEIEIIERKGRIKCALFLFQSINTTRRTRPPLFSSNDISSSNSVIAARTADKSGRLNLLSPS